MKLLTLPLHVRRRCLEHEPDLLTPAAEARNQKFSAPCPRCGGAMHQALDADRPFTPHSMLPRTIARCVDCGCEIDTQTGVQIKLGNPAKIEEPFPIIKPQDD